MINYDSVLLIASGGPTRPAEVQPFLKSISRGQRLPADRLSELARHYERIGGRSPFNDLTMQQARSLEQFLHMQGRPLPVYVGMRNWKPYLDETLTQMVTEGRRQTIGVILSPQQSEASWGRYEADATKSRGQVGELAPAVDFAAEWHAHPLFIEAIAERARSALRRTPREQWPAVKLVFTAQSIPTAMAERWPYVQQVEEGARAVAKRLQHDNWSIAYQSRGGRPADSYLEPDICDALRSLAAEGVSDVLISPIGFVCDSAEILYDLDIEAKQVAEEVGIRLARAAVLNDHSAFIRMLAEVVLAKLQG